MILLRNKIVFETVVFSETIALVYCQGVGTGFSWVGSQCHRKLGMWRTCMAIHDFPAHVTVCSGKNPVHRVTIDLNITVALPTVYIILYHYGYQ